MLAFVNSLAELLGVLVVEEKGKSGDVFDGSGITYLNFELLHAVVVVKHFDRAPKVLTLFVAGGDTMALIRMLGAVLEPLLRGAVEVPGIVAG